MQTRTMWYINWEAYLMQRYDRIEEDVSNMKDVIKNLIETKKIEIRRSSWTLQWKLRTQKK